MWLVIGAIHLSKMIKPENDILTIWQCFQKTVLNHFEE